MSNDLSKKFLAFFKKSDKASKAIAKKEWGNIQTGRTARAIIPTLRVKDENGEVHEAKSVNYALEATNIFVADVDSYFSSHSLEAVLKELFLLIGSAPAETYNVVDSAGNQLIDLNGDNIISENE